MKKIYLLLLLCCLNLGAFAQAVTVNVFSTGVVGTYVTGYSSSTTYTEGNMVVTGTAPIRRGYTVFDLSTALIPAGSVVNSVVLNYNVQTYGGGSITGSSTNVYVGDLGLLFGTPATIYADMVPPAAPSVSAVAYTAGTGNKTVASTAGAVAVVQAHLNGKLSWCLTHTGTATFTITGEGGTPTLAGAHAPYLTIVYCPPPTGVTATASPNPICEGDALTLTSTGSGISGGYTWTGPGGYSSTLASPTFTASLTSAGVYTLSAVNSCVTYSATATATTSFVTVNPLPAPITGSSNICTGDAFTLNDATLLGSWSSSAPGVISIGASTGLASGVSAGSATISYMLGTGCFVTMAMTDNDPPAAITGPATAVCVNSTLALSDAVAGGTWTSSAPLTASVGTSSGIVTGLAAGTATVTYTTGGCPPVTYNITVNPLPAVITGATNVCQGNTTPLGDGTSGGTWSSSNITIAMVGTSGVVSGVSPGTVVISYTLPATGCAVSQNFTVNPLPAAITGPTEVCVGSVITLSDSDPGGFWSSADGTIATVNPVTGDVTGVSSGTVDIVYTLSTTGCSISTPILVHPLPAAIAGTLTICDNTTTTLTDTDPGGVWSSSNTAVATVGTSSGLVTGVAAGTTDISYTLSTGCAIVAPVTVNASPLAVITPTGPTTFCVGGNVNLNSSTGAGYTYQWSDAGVPIAGETNSSYNATTTSSFTVEVTNTLGCSKVSAAVIVTAGINPTVDYAGSTSFCVGQSLKLTANTGGTVGTITYQWYKDGAAIPAGTGVSYTAVATGVYKVVVNISGGSGSCIVSSPDVAISVHPLPTPTVSLLTSTTLATGGGYSGYQWYLNTIAVPGATSVAYTPVTNGSYRVRVSDAIGCQGYSNYYMFDKVGVNQVNVADLKIYPNPANDVVNIESPVSVRAVVSTVEGKTLIDEKDAKTVNISSLSTGLYIIMLYDTNGEMLKVQKLIKE